MTFELPAPTGGEIDWVFADRFRSPDRPGSAQGAEQPFRSEDVEDPDPVLAVDALDPQTEFAGVALQELRAAMLQEEIDPLEAFWRASGGPKLDVGVGELGNKLEEEGEIRHSPSQELAPPVLDVQDPDRVVLGHTPA